MSTVDVTAFGADPSGRIDSFDAVRAAAAVLEEHDTLYFPQGEYWTARRDALRPEHFVPITVSNVVVCGEGATLRNFMFNVAGAYGEPVALGAVSESSASLKSLTDVNLVAGDYAQLLSSTNAYSAQAGADQGGSRSPSSDILYPVRFSEFARVRDVAGDVLHFTADLIFDRYQQPARGMEKAELAAQGPELRKVYFARNVVFSGLVFDMREHRYFRTLRFRATRDCAVRGCEFLAGSQPGRHLQASDSLRLKFTGNSSSRRPGSDARGSSWNSFMFAAGCQDVLFADNRVFGDWQAVDFTSFGERDFGESEDATTWRTTQQIRVVDNVFNNCSDGITTHPGTYDATISGNIVRSSATGARIRSRRNLLCGNSFETSRAGLVVSSFFDETIVSSNRIRRTDSMEWSGRWVGLLALLTSQEVMTSNAVANVLISGNVFSDAAQRSSSLAVQFIHDRRISSRAKSDFVRDSGNSCDVRIVANAWADLKSELDRDIRGVNFAG
ncbi:NosD domain-containing protein [Agrococcus sp. Ld7]|uniref:NosD domain-containing protein n=1 Tax=Agrococcus sp. Ld7 TaxID=649148 RepID=UPI00386C8834